MGEYSSIINRVEAIYQTECQHLNQKHKTAGLVQSQVYQPDAIIIGLRPWVQCNNLSHNVDICTHAICKRNTILFIPNPVPSDGATYTPRCMLGSNVIQPRETLVFS